MSLRVKLMLALFVTGLAAVGMVGGLTYYSVTSKFDTIRSRQAAEHFHRFMTAYLTEYGDWDTAIKSESFDRFVQRKETEEGPAQGGEHPSDMLERMPPNIDRKSQDWSERHPAYGPAPQRAQEGRPGPEGRPQQPPGRAGADGVPRQPQGDDPVSAAQRQGPPGGTRPPQDSQFRSGPPRAAGPAVQLRAGGEDDGRAPRDGIRPPPPDGIRLLPPDGIRPPPPDGQPWPPQDGVRPPPRDGVRPPRDGMRPRPGEGERPPQIQGGLAQPHLYRATYAAAPQGNGNQGAPAPDAASRTDTGAASAAARDTAGAADATGGNDGRRPPPDSRALDGTPFPPGPGDGPVRDREDRPGRPGRDGRPGGPPPFRFVLADKHYTVLLGAGQYGPGAVLPTKARAKARPIVVKGETVAYVSTEGVATPSKQEQEFLDAMESSLLAGAGAAAALALGLGLLLAGGLSRRLSKLTGAVRAMQGGALRQQVPAEGKDEVAALAGAFNDMSEQLARSHEELKASHQTILEQAEQLKELSIRDALTSLYNRRHFDEQANTLYQQAVRHKRPISLVIGDIDFFKKINDNFSHATGDVVLRHVGAILRQHVRLSDLVARYGGEEFVLALPDTDADQAAALCNKLRAIIESHPWHEVHPNLKVTMSMGVFADYAVGTAEAMLQKADELLYKAKEAGRNRVCHA